MKEMNGKRVASSLEEVLDPQHTALILVDPQNDFCADEGAFAKVGKDISLCKGILPRLRLILEAARRCGVFVVFTQQVTLPDGLSDSPAWLYRKSKAHRSIDYCIADTWGCRILDDLAPMRGEVVVEKHRPSAFTGTDLDLVLRSNSIVSVAVVGVVTEGCVESTARDASFHDYHVVYVGDCMASTSQEIHEATLKIAVHRGHDVILSGTVLDIWTKNPRSKPRFA